MERIEEWLLNKIREVESSVQKEDLYTGRITISGVWASELIEEALSEHERDIKKLNIMLIELLIIELEEHLTKNHPILHSSTFTRLKNIYGYS